MISQFENRTIKCLVFRWLRILSVPYSDHNNNNCKSLTSLRLFGNAWYLYCLEFIFGKHFFGDRSVNNLEKNNYFVKGSLINDVMLRGGLQFVHLVSNLALLSNEGHNKKSVSPSKYVQYNISTKRIITARIASLLRREGKQAVISSWKINPT